MKWNKSHITLAVFLPIQMILMRIVAQNPQFVETYYSNGIYPYISSFFRIVLGWIPFSIGDMLISFLMFFILRFFFLLIKNRFKNLIPKLMQAVAFASIIYFCFYLFWGLNYYREPLANNLGYEQSKYSTEELVKVTNHIIEKLNCHHLEITENDTVKVESPYEPQDFYTIAPKGYENLAKKYPQFRYQYHSIKNSVMSELQSYNGTSGYLNPLTGEAQVNKLVPKTSYPTTTCHEMAHQIGFAAENEANFVGFLAANFSDDVYFKYASYRMAFGYCISEVRKRNPELSKQLWQTVNKGVIKDFNSSYQFWQQFKNPFEPVIKKGYSAYLKANKQAKGTDSYNYVVDLLISYFKE